MTIHIPLMVLYGFLLVLARVSAFVAFLPVPGFRSAPEPVRAALALGLTLALSPFWPRLDSAPGMGQLLAWIAGEAAFGLFAGLTVQFMTDGFQTAAQMIGLQAGYAYASTVDPSSQADSGILQVILLLGTGVLFFTLGVDRTLLRALALSLERVPAATWTPATQGLDWILRLGSGMLLLALRIAVPVTAVLLVMDLSIALLGRMQHQLQLLSLAFPVKMLAALAILAALAPVFPRLLSSAVERSVSVLCRASGAC